MKMDYTDKISELRTAFLEKYGEKTDGDSNNIEELDINSERKYDERDVEKLNSNDDFAHSFLKFLKGDVQKTLNMLDYSFKWRKQIGLNDLNEASFEKEVLEKGNIYYHNHDKNGIELLFFKFIDIKDTETTRKYIAYMFDKRFRKDPTKKMVLIFDLSGVGVMSLQFDLFKYLLACATDYFPNTEYLLNFEMAWVLNTAWKALRLLMSEETRKYVHMVKKKEIVEFVAEDQLPEHMGGTDTYKYVYEPETEATS